MKIAKILKNDTVNGIGICVSLFVQGCPHHCRGCFNKSTWNEEGGLEIEKNDLFKLLDESINKNGIKRNLSLLGGEPLAPNHVKELSETIEKIRLYNPKIKIFCWTGYTYEQLLNRNCEYTNLILETIDYLIDGKFEEDKKDIGLLMRGSSNQRILPLNNNPNIEKL